MGGLLWRLVFVTMLFIDVAVASRQQAGSIRGVLYDKDFDTPLGGVQVQIVETGQKTASTDQGNFVFTQVPPGKYTLLFTKDGYARQVKADVVVVEGRLTDVDASLASEFTDMDEFVVQDVLQAGTGTEAALLQLRLDSPALMDSISAELMSKAGASDAAGALRLVAGASVQDDKSAVIRGLPDRYVSSQMNGVRLPTADEDKRAVELDQFPAAVLDSIQVSKTFTPDQQGDASGGAVDVRLKGIPDETIFQFKSEVSYNSQVTGRNDFLSYHGGGVGAFGSDHGDRAIQYDNLGQNWTGAVGTSETDAPIDYKMSGAIGGKKEFADDLKIGAFLSVFYKRDSAFFDNGIDDSYWVEAPGAKMTPQTFQGTPLDGDFKTALYDVTQGSQMVQWGGLATLGIENKNNALTLAYLYSKTTEDTATLAEDTRGKEYFFPGYDPNNPTGIGNTPADINAAPYLRLETLEYTERTTGTLQLNGKHTLPVGDFGIDDGFTFHAPEIDWVAAYSTAEMDQPDKRQFGALWLPPSFHPGAPPFLPPFTTQPIWLPYKPSANFTLGNEQRIWKDIQEDGTEYALNLKLPFTQWSGNDGYVKTGIFDDRVDRKFDQETFSNFNDNSSFVGDWDEPWSDVFPSENHPITASTYDVDYKGKQHIAAWYSMMDLPLTSWFKVIGGARVEKTDISIVNAPEQDATWFPPGATAPVTLLPGDGDVSFSQDDLLPSVAFELTPVEKVSLRGSYAQTVARQTFKELSPIIQEEYLGGPIFIGNPDLGMSSLRNYDLRLDYTPYEGGLLSTSWFYKDIKDPIEYVQRGVNSILTYTTAVNYPSGKLDGWEFELRQKLGQFWDPLDGVAVGANATFIHSKVNLPANEVAEFNLPNIQAPMSSRDMTDAPDHLYNFYATYDLAATATQFAAFYTIQGDTLVAGAGQINGNFVPSVYAKEYGTLNMSVTQALGEYFKVQFQAKNLTNPKIEEVYRSKYIGSDVTRSSYTKGVELSLAIAFEMRF